MLLISLLSALGSAGAMAAEQSHFEHFITRDGAQLKDGDQVFRFAGSTRQNCTELKMTRAELVKQILAVGAIFQMANR